MIIDIPEACNFQYFLKGSLTRSALAFIVRMQCDGFIQRQAEA